MCSIHKMNMGNNLFKTLMYTNDLLLELIRFVLNNGVVVNIRGSSVRLWQ